ncbi:MAG: TIM44-like domain-containing protein [Candidatus Coprovivens sp.]
MLLESYIYSMPDFIDIFLLLLITFVVIGLYIIRKKGSPENDIYKSNETLLKKYNITNKEVLTKEIFNLFSSTEEARTREDKKAIEYLCSQELSKQYIKELSNLHEMELEYTNKNYELVTLKLKEIKEENNTLKITAVIKTKCISYVQSTEGEMLDGDIDDKEDRTNTIIVKKDLNKPTVNCLNCNAPLEEQAENKCPYCNTPFNYKSTKWTMLSNKKGDLYEEK